MSGTPKSLYRDEGVVLRTQKLGEADRIVTVLTRRTGKVRAVAKGVRRTKSKFGARPEPFSHVDLQLYTGRNLDIVSQAESIRSYGNEIVADYRAYTAGTAVLETADRLTSEEKEPSLRMFLLVVGALRTLAEGTKPAPLVLDAFLLRAMSVAGWEPALGDCARCGGARPAPALLRPGRRHGVPVLPAHRLGDAEPGHRRTHGGAVVRRLGPGRGEPGHQPAGEQRPGRRPAAVAPGTRAALAAAGGPHVRRDVKRPAPHPSGARPPLIPADKVPRHVAIVMDGNGRWAKQRGLPRTAGHEAGEASLFDCVEGAIELGIGAISAYAFSTENWRRSPEEVRFLMGFNRDVIRRRRDEMHELGVRVRWAGRRPRLWRSVINELEIAEELTRDNDVLTLTMCVNYGGRAEIADAAAAIGREAAAGRLNPDKVDERTVARFLDEPDMPDVDLFVRSSGENRTSNFLLWQSAYAELVFLDTLWPDFDRRHLWAACEEYASRQRRFGSA